MLRWAFRIEYNNTCAWWKELLWKPQRKLHQGYFRREREREAQHFFASAFGTDSRQSHIIANTLRERRSFVFCFHFSFGKAGAVAKNEQKKGVACAREWEKVVSSLSFSPYNVEVGESSLYFHSSASFKTTHSACKWNWAASTHSLARSPLYLLRWRFSHKL